MGVRSRVVLLEPKEHIRELIIFNLESNFNFDVIEAYNPQELLSFLEMDKEIMLCICDIDVDANAPKEVLGLLEAQGRNVPIVVTGEAASEEIQGLEANNYLMFFPKKGCILPMVKHIKSICQIDDSVSTMEYTRVAMKTLIHFEGLSNDLFIRLGTEDKHRYIKYLSQGDRVSIEDVERKKEKGLEHLYIKKLAAKWILIIVDENMEQIAVSEEGDFVINMSEVDTENEEADALLDDILNDMKDEKVTPQDKPKVTKATFRKEEVKKEVKKEEPPKPKEVPKAKAPPKPEPVKKVEKKVEAKEEEKVEEAEEEFEDIPIPAMEKRTEQKKEAPAPATEESDLEMPVMQEDISKTFKLEEKFVAQVNIMTKKSLEKVKRMPRLDKFLKKINIARNSESFFNNRLGLLINISCAIARTLDWGTEATLEKLIFTAYIHDCILVDYPHLARLQTIEEFRKVKESLPETERNLFLEHPKITAKMLEQRGDIAPDVYSMVLQHHELPDKSGFPEKLNGQRIIPMASLFIVSIDLATYICDDENWDIELFLETNKEKYTGQHFRRVLQSLEKVAKSLKNPKAQAA